MAVAKKSLYSFAPIILLAASPSAHGYQFPDCVNGPLARNLICDTNASPPDRAAALVSILTLEEKFPQLIDQAPGVPRIGLPAYEWWGEALHGLALLRGMPFAGLTNVSNTTDFSDPSVYAHAGPYSHATSFALPILLSAAFDDDNIAKVGSAISTEARAFSNAGRAGLDYWTPNVNPFKDPRWGRGLETPGEDPFRIKGYVKHLLHALEGDSNPVKKVVATCKHYAAYDLEDWNGVTRYEFDAKVSLQELVEYYLAPFQQCARDSKVGSIMCSYNSVNGVPACANEYLLQTVLRNHWGWTEDNNYIVSDCGAVQNIYKDHHYVETAAQAAAASYNAGTDNVCQHNLTDVAGAYSQSIISEKVIDRALARQYEGLVRVGYFDPNANNTSYRRLSWKDVSTTESQQLARRTAAEGMVLLKNSGALPLKLRSNATIAVVGMWANATGQLLATYFGIPPYIHGPLYAAQQLGYRVNYANGPTLQNETSGDWTQPGLAAAEHADIVLYFGGIDITVERESLDRTNIAWSPSQLAHIEQLGALGKPLVVIQMGTSLDHSPLLNNENVSALVWAGYGGQEGGTAVFDVLTGFVAPAARLPISIYPSSYVTKIPMTEMSLRPSASHPGRTYMFNNDTVLPFGYGLHYTTFEPSFSTQLGDNWRTQHRQFNISSLLDQCSEKHKDLCTSFSVPFSVRNTGSTTSDFVGLVFVSHTNGPEPYAIKELVGYKRLREIFPGEAMNTQIDISLGSLARVDEKGNTVLYAGRYKLLLDEPTRDEVEFELIGEQVVLDYWPQPQ
ncbi:glycoside hydrolase [Byssothecium circinans]|uniref:xylan 1,4-beta-xylosidase n=1 Tax=Byssothecium circinans TaxID=147558 RepID=A0A6A5UFB8_9PLEO|nr:glycoside hydrolase [Byssothecium circinans]